MSLHSSKIVEKLAKKALGMKKAVHDVEGGGGWGFRRIAPQLLESSWGDLGVRI